MPCEQRKTDLFFQEPDLAGQGGLDKPQAIGRFAQGTALGDLDEATELPEVHSPIPDKVSNPVIAPIRSFILHESAAVVKMTPKACR
jgi:hypothetical protein